MVSINKKILTDIFDDKKFEDEIYDLLNQLIDQELEKDDNDIDFEFIDNCCEIINEIISTGEYNISKIISLTETKDFNEKIIKLGKKGLNSTFKILLIAAIILTSTITASATLNLLSGSTLNNNETTSPVSQTAVSEKNDIKQEHSDENKEIELVDKSVLVSAGETTYSGSQQLLAEVGDVMMPSSRINYKSKGITKTEIIKDTLKTSENTKFDEEAYIEKNCENKPDCLNGEYHNYGGWTETKAPTCVDLGEKQRQCSACGKTQTCPVKATGIHDCSGELIPPSFYPNSQSEDGYYKEYCNVCKGELYEAIPYVKYVVVDNVSFEYDGKVHKPKVVAVLDRNKREIPSYLYNLYIIDGEKRQSYNSAKTINSNSYYQLIVDFDVDKSGKETSFLENSYGANSTAILIFEITPQKPILQGIATGNSSIIPFWKSQSSLCDAYQIQYSKTSDFTNSKTVYVNSKSATKKEINNLEKGEIYYVRMRGVNNYAQSYDPQYTFWSEVRKITVQ